MEAEHGKLKFYNKNIFVLLVAILFIDLIFVFWRPGLWPTLLLLLPVGYLFAKAGKFTRGLEGEADISDELRKLPPEFTFVSDILIGSRGNIDKIVIGPSGVWVLEVKSHRGNIREPSEKFLNQVWAESYAVRDLIKEKLNLDFSVQPVLLFASPKAKMRFGYNKVKGVYVIQKKWLNDLIVMHPVSALDTDTTAKIKVIFLSK